MNTPLHTNELPLRILPTLALKIGLNEAIILQRVHELLDPHVNETIFEGRHWVRHTYPEWKKQFPFWCEKTIWRAIAHLEGFGFLNSFITTDGLRKIKHYSIDYEKLNSFLKQNLSSHLDPPKN